MTYRELLDEACESAGMSKSEIEHKNAEGDLLFPSFNMDMEVTLKPGAEMAHLKAALVGLIMQARANPDLLDGAVKDIANHVSKN